MTDPQTSERKGIRKNGSFRIEDFLDDNYRLFAIMGVFGALAIYLKDLSANGSPFSIEIGIVSCFILFILVSFLILSKVFKKYKDEPFSAVFLTMSRGNIERILFVIPFFTLVMAIAYYILTAFSESFELLFGMILLVFGMIFSFGFLDVIGRIIKNKNLSAFIGSLFLAIFSGIGLYVVPYYYSSSLIPFLFFFGSIATASAVFFITGLIGLIISLIGRLLRSD